LRITKEPKLIAVQGKATPRANNAREASAMAIHNGNAMPDMFIQSVLSQPEPAT